jgi:hypothetical protein
LHKIDKIKNDKKWQHIYYLMVFTLLYPIRTGILASLAFCAMLQFQQEFREGQFFQNIKTPK